MNFLDMKTVIFSQLLSNTICLIVMFFLFYHNYKKYNCIKFFFIYYIMQVVGLILILARGNISNFISMIVSNLLIVGGTIIAYEGLIRFTDKKIRVQRFNVILLFIFLILQIYFLYFNPILKVRTIIFSVFLLIYCIQIVYYLKMQQDENMKKIVKSVSIAYSFYIIITFSRLIILILEKSNNDFFKSGLYDTLMVIFYQMAFIILTFCLYIMINQRLVLEITKKSEELQKSKIEADKSNKAKSIFLANMSHELRTPLNAILGFSDLLCDSTSINKDEELKKYSEYINYSGNILLNLVNDILDLNKVDAGKLELVYCKIDFAKLLDELINSIKSLSMKNSIEIITEIDNDIGILVADEKRVKQIFYNLISNAIKYTEKNKKIGIKSYSKDNKIYTTVWDEGIGIDEKNIEIIFEPFEQVKNSKIINGTGLGLSITKRLVELHNGRIYVNSILNEGSQFTVILPNGKENSYIE